MSKADLEEMDKKEGKVNGVVPNGELVDHDDSQVLTKLWKTFGNNKVAVLHNILRHFWLTEKSTIKSIS